MSATVQIDDVRFRDALNRLASLGLDMGRVLRVEARQVIKSILRQTAPPDRKQGQSAVEVDLRRVFMPVEGSILRKVKPSNDGRLTVLWATDSGQIFGTRPENFLPSVTPSEMSRLHESHRQQNGRVSGMGPRIKKRGEKVNEVNRYVVPRATFRRYQREKVSHVGKLRSGFAHAARAVGLPVPSWIARNMTAATGSVVDNLGRGASPSITSTNTAPGAASRTAGIVHRALAARVKAIHANVKRMLKHGSGSSGDFGYGN